MDWGKGIVFYNLLYAKQLLVIEYLTVHQAVKGHLLALSSKTTGIGKQFIIGEIPSRTIRLPAMPVHDYIFGGDMTSIL